MTISVPARRQESIDAVADVRGRWPTPSDGPTDQPGAKSTDHYEDEHRWRIRVVPRPNATHLRYEVHCQDG